MLKVGDICECNYNPYYSHIFITKVNMTHYFFTTTALTHESCHVRSILGLSLKPILSNMKSLDEARSQYPELFI